MLRHSLNLIAISLVSAAAAAHAQTITSGPYTTNQYVGDTNVLVQHHCSTAKEGALRGTADLVRSYGQATRNVAEAQVYAAQAQEQRMHNRQLVTIQYYERKEMYEASKLREEKPVAAPYLTDAKTTAPKANTPVVSNDGRIEWPVALKTDDCTSARQLLEVYFSHHGAEYTDTGVTPTSAEAHAAIGELSTNLKSRISELSSGDYMVAKNFLKNLEKAAG